MFDLGPAVPQLVRLPGELTVAIASRSEHFPARGEGSSRLVLTLNVVARAFPALAHE